MATIKAYMSSGTRIGRERNQPLWTLSAEDEAQRILADVEPRGRGITTSQDLPNSAWRFGFIIEPRNPAVVALADALAAFVEGSQA